MLVSRRIVIAIPRCVCIVLIIAVSSQFILFSLLGDCSSSCLVLAARISEHGLVDYLAGWSRTLDNACHLCCVDATNLIVSALVQYAQANGLLLGLSLLIFSVRRRSLKTHILTLTTSY